jgi:putative DNA primase/helicase
VAKPLQILKTARIQNLATNTYLERIEFRASNGQAITIELAPSVINDLGQFSKHLRDAGAILPSNKQAFKSLLETIASASAKRELQYAAQPGWTRDHRTFVRTSGAIGKAKKRILGFRRSNHDDPKGMICHDGTVEKWKRLIGIPARYSTIMMFSIAAAFAGPVLSFAEKGSFGFFMFSPSRTGKTLATLVAGSVIGLGSISTILNWNLTDARLQELLAEFNDSLVPIDDLMNMKGSERDKYARIKSLAYIIAAGSETGRHTSFEKNARTWTSIVLTSNEFSLLELAARVRAEREQGETIRLIDLPATYGDAPDIFDMPPKIVPPGERSAWRKKMFDELYSSCLRQQGFVFDNFLSRLASYGPHLRKDLTAFVQEFAETVRDEADGKLARDVASKYGIVYAAGMVAIQFDILPWKTKQLSEALQRCYFASRDLLPDPGRSIRSGRGMLRSFLKALPTAKQLKKRDFITADGFSEKRAAYYRCLVKREKFNAIFSSDNQRKAVTEQLITENIITKATGSMEPKLQHIWPDGQRYRSIEISWPIVAGS